VIVGVGDGVTVGDGDVLGVPLAVPLADDVGVGVRVDVSVTLGVCDELPEPVLDTEGDCVPDAVNEADGVPLPLRVVDGV
jgi:hypothetical protein